MSHATSNSTSLQVFGGFSDNDTRPSAIGVACDAMDIVQSGVDNLWRWRAYWSLRFD